MRVEQEFNEDPEEEVIQKTYAAGLGAGISPAVLARNVGLASFEGTAAQVLGMQQECRSLRRQGRRMSKQ